MTAVYTWDVFSTLDGYGSYGPEGDWGGYWSKQGPSCFPTERALRRLVRSTVHWGCVDPALRLPVGPKKCPAVLPGQVILEARSSALTLAHLSARMSAWSHSARVQAGARFSGGTCRRPGAASGGGIPVQFQGSLVHPQRVGP